MEINKEDKITILLNLLNERYQSAHRIRERSFRMTLWVLGLAVAFVWILVSGTSLYLSQKWILTILVFILGSTIFWFLHSLEKGAEKNHKVMIDLEEALGCYKEGCYLDSRGLFPEKYKKSARVSWRSHFRSIYILIIPIAILVTILIWLTPPKNVTDSKSKKISSVIHQQKS